MWPAIPSLLYTVNLVLPALAAYQPLFQSIDYDLGDYGAYPLTSYASFNLVSPRLNILQWNPQCEDGQYVFLEPRGGSVPTPGPMILDAKGNLIWMEGKFGQAMDFKVQRYKGEDYLTFWTGTDSGTHGTGSYYMVSSGDLNVGGYTD